VRGALTWLPVTGLTITPSVFYQNRDKNNIDDYWSAFPIPAAATISPARRRDMGDKDHFTLAALKADYILQQYGADLEHVVFRPQSAGADYSGTLYDLSISRGSSHTLESDYEHRCTGGFVVSTASIQPRRPRKPPPLLDADRPRSSGYDGVAPFGHYEATNNVTNTQDNFTQEVRLQRSDSDSPFTWIAGVFYSNQSQLSVEEINDPQLPALTEYLWGLDMLSAWGEDLLPNGDDLHQSHARPRTSARGLRQRDLCVTPN